MTRLALAAVGVLLASSVQGRGQPLNAPLALPQDYRDRIAVLLAGEYAREGRGTPEISDVATGSGPLGASVGFCVRYPAEPRFGFVVVDNRRIVSIVGRRAIDTLGTVQYKAHTGPTITCSGAKGWKRFHELERAAARTRS